MPGSRARCRAVGRRHHRRPRVPPHLAAPAGTASGATSFDLLGSIISLKIQRQSMRAFARPLEPVSSDLHPCRRIIAALPTPETAGCVCRLFLTQQLVNPQTPCQVLRLTDPPNKLRERAGRARLHAIALIMDDASPRLLAYANELDALADKIDASVGTETAARPC